ncbi:MAG: S8 family serine peptidase, partial [Planctomycetota bacterium]
MFLNHTIVFASLIASAGAAAQPATIAAPFAPGEVIVVTNGAVPERGTLIAGYPVIERSDFGRAALVRVPIGQEPEAINALNALESVAVAELNYAGQGASVPNDTFFESQWHHENMGQSSGRPGADIESLGAWQYTRGDSSTVIAVLDTGIDSDHPEFAGRFLTDGFDFVNEDADPEADHPHGAWVSGVVVANDGNGFGTAGVDHRARVLPVKVLNENNAGFTFDLVQGLDFAAARSDVHIICMSLISYPGTTSLRNALDNAAAAGKVLISCGSNSGANADVSWPGASPATITIGATTRIDARAFFSGTGSSIDFVAPGDDITTIEPFTSLDRRDVVSGCSFATPIAAGVAGLIRARTVELGVPFTQQLVFDMLQAGAEDEVGFANEDTPGRDDFMGWGRINARASLYALEAQFGCLPDVNRDGQLNPADFSAWVIAFNNAQLAGCDQNGDGLCDPAD